MRMLGPINSGSAAGSNGSATATGTSDVIVSGKFLGAYIKYNDTPPATTDVTIKTKGDSPAVPSITLLAVSDANTSGIFLVRKQAVDTSAAAITGEYVPIPVWTDKIQVVIAQANAGDNVDVWVLME